MKYPGSAVNLSLEIIEDVQFKCQMDLYLYPLDFQVFSFFKVAVNIFSKLLLLLIVSTIFKKNLFISTFWIKPSLVKHTSAVIKLCFLSED